MNEIHSMNYRAIKVQNFAWKFYLKISPEQIIVQVHLTLFSVRKMLGESSFSFFDSLMVFMTHCVSIESPNEMIFELEKSRVVVCPRMRIYRDEFLETEKKRTEWKKEVIDTFWLFSQCTELSIFTFKEKQNWFLIPKNN